MEVDPAVATFWIPMWLAFAFAGLGGVGGFAFGVWFTTYQNIRLAVEEEDDEDDA